MAEIFKPAYYIDPKTNKRVNKKFPGAVRKKSPTWWIRYYDPSGKRHKVKGYTDKKATETKASELERRAIRLDAGLVDPSVEHAKRPLAEHAEDFRRYLAAKGNTDTYVALIHFRLTALLDGCRFLHVADIQASAVVEFLAQLRQRQEKSIKTANEYLAAAKGFTRWMWRDKRTGLDLLAGLSKLANGESDIRHARRDLSADELDRLLFTARASNRDFRGLTGQDRYMLYLTACATGLRVSELASMTPDNFDMSGDTPNATVQAACTKNRKEAVQPLPRDVADVLREYLQGKPTGKPVWPGKSWPVHASIMIQRDLAEARKQWLSAAQDDRQRAEWEQCDFLAYQDAEGRFADFHSLRHTFITMVGKAGVSPKEHQDLARHSTYSLTSRYTHSRFYDLAAAVQGLPILTRPEPSAETLAATGTDPVSAPVAQNGQNSLGLFLGPQQAYSGDKLRQTETEIVNGQGNKKTGNYAENTRNPGFCSVGGQKRDTGVEPV
jgi:integrase